MIDEDDLLARIERIEAHLWPPDPLAPAAPTWSERSGLWPVNELLSDGGKTWRNVAGVPLTTKPTDFPGTPSQWVHLFIEAISEPEPEPGEPAWSVGLNVAVGDIVTHNGHRWRAVVAHTTHAGWIPSPATWSVWTDLGLV